MTAIEAAVSVALVLGFVGAVSTAHAVMLKRARELALKADLQRVRAEIEFFNARHGRLPRALDELAMVPIGRLTTAPRPLDVFGRPYRYEPATGNVHSTTPGYQAW